MHRPLLSANMIIALYAKTLTDAAHAFPLHSLKTHDNLSPGSTLGDRGCVSSTLHIQTLTEYMSRKIPNGNPV